MNGLRRLVAWLTSRRWWRFSRERALPTPSDFSVLARALAERMPIFGHEVRANGDIVLSGRSESCQFRLAYCPAVPLVRRAAETLVEVEPQKPALPASFCLFPRTFTGGAPGSDQIVRTGDRLFDRRWVIEGERRAVLVAMNAETRALIGRSGSLSVGSGWLYMLVDGLNTELEAASAQVQHAMLLAERLAEGLGAEASDERLVSNLCTETNGQVRLELTRELLRMSPADSVLDELMTFWEGAFGAERRTQVRLQVLRLFVHHAPEHPGTLALLARALLDASPDVRLLAARHSGDRGLAVMRQVAGTRFANEETRIEALFLLGQRLSEFEFREVLILCAKEAAPRVRRYALRRLLDDPQPNSSDELLQIAKGSDREAAAELAETLARVPGFLAEPALIQLLSSRSTKVKRAAALALGDVGTVEAVPHLLTLALPIIFDGSLRDVARTAILQIQYRIQNGDVGGLSLAESNDAVGALSAADDEQGGLSLP